MLTLVGLATKLVYGSDLVAAGGIDWKAHVKHIEPRPAAQRITADRKTAMAAA
jgi:glutathione S-transferase